MNILENGKWEMRSDKTFRKRWDLNCDQKANIWMPEAQNKFRGL